MCTNSGLLTGTGAETVYDTTVIIEYAINGIAYRLAAVTDGATPTSDQEGVVLTALAVSEGCALLWLVDAAGLVSLMQGATEGLDGADAFEFAPEFPEMPEGTVAFAYSILVNAAAGSEFIIGTDNWNQTGMTATHTNIMVLPSRPQTS